MNHHHRQLKLLLIQFHGDHGFSQHADGCATISTHRGRPNVVGALQLVEGCLVYQRDMSKVSKIMATGCPLISGVLVNLPLLSAKITSFSTARTALLW